jgi:hypothetical protein
MLSLPAKVNRGTINDVTAKAELDLCIVVKTLCKTFKTFGNG